ncbi:MAG: hypothetical protein GF329_12250 [Candidatus Lokiarchaeota archaeon]|nr:hypothetical protein [Candidatus Lokiarchaeota archaeon]
MTKIYYQLPLELELWITATIIMWIMAIYFLYRSRKIDKEARPFIYGIIIFATSFGTARLIETLRKYILFGFNYYDVIDTNFNIVGTSLWLRIIYYIISWIGIAIFYFTFEKYVMRNKTKFILTIGSIIESFLAVSLYFTSRNEWIFLFSVLNFLIIGLFPIVLFLWLAYKSPYRSTRLSWIIITLGFVLFALGMMGDLPEAWVFISELSQLIIRYFTPLAQIFGFALMGVGFAIIYQ